jgi:hypothetical protein
MMATRSNGDKYDQITEDDVPPLAHCATLADARKELQALAWRYENATHVVENIEFGHHFKNVGKHKTRTIWAKEVGYARSLKMVNLMMSTAACMRTGSERVMLRTRRRCCSLNPSLACSGILLLLDRSSGVHDAFTSRLTIC